MTFSKGQAKATQDVGIGLGKVGAGFGRAAIAARFASYAFL